MTTAALHRAEKKVCVRRSIAQGDAPPVLDFTEHVFNFMALFIERFVIFYLFLSTFLGGMQGSRPLFLKSLRNKSASYSRSTKRHSA